MLILTSRKLEWKDDINKNLIFPFFSFLCRHPTHRNTLIYGRTIKSRVSYVLNITATNSYPMMQIWQNHINNAVLMILSRYSLIFVDLWYKSLGKTCSSWRIEDQSEVLFIEWWGLSDEIFGAGEMLQLPDSPPQRHWEYRLVIW